MKKRQARFFPGFDKFSPRRLKEKPQKILSKLNKHFVGKSFRLKSERCWKVPLGRVWPDVEIKSSPNFSKSCPTPSHSSFYLKRDVYKEPKRHHTFGLTLKETLTQWILKNRPIWSHCLARSLGRKNPSAAAPFKAADSVTRCCSKKQPIVIQKQPQKLLTQFLPEKWCFQWAQKSI